VGTTAGQGAGPGRRAVTGAAAVAGALAACRAALRGSPGFSYPDSWLTWQVQGQVYAEPTGTDADGFVTVGHVWNRPWGRTGFVLLHPESGDVRTVWVDDG